MWAGDGDPGRHDKGECLVSDSDPLAWWRRFAAEDGQGLAEYALILVLIAIVAIVALIFLGSNLSTILSTVGDSV